MLRSRLLHDVPHAFTDIAVGDLRPSAEGFEARAAGLVAAIGGRGPLVSVSQVHGDRVVHAGDVRAGTEADAIVSTLPGQVVAVRVADCAPVLLADPVAGLVAAVHAGWRGVVAGVVPAALRCMVERGARADRVVVAIGACIGAGAFQVGADVLQSMNASGLGAHLSPDAAPERWRADLRGAIGEQLIAAGVLASKFDVDSACTFSRPLDLFSYRRDGQRSGRMAVIIGI